MTWEMIELKEGEPVVFLAVHALRWNWQEWGEPKVGFVDSDEPDSADVQALVEAVNRVINEFECCEGAYCPACGYARGKGHSTLEGDECYLAAALKPFTPADD